ncbi:unnamed protein product [Caenorhabditis sp. 36 PRJEB53466]|nr:unnamed protein product [Caenorhabditis sp. 36 PRJEB53466]
MRTMCCCENSCCQKTSRSTTHTRSASASSRRSSPFRSRSTSRKSRKSIIRSASASDVLSSLRSLSTSDTASVGSLRKWKVVALPKKDTEVVVARSPFYMGVVTRKSAERRMGLMKFAVYHQLPYAPLLENMREEVTLTGVYKTSNGIFTHFAVNEHIADHGNPEFYLETGASRRPKMFCSIEELMDHYCRK